METWKEIQGYEGIYEVSSQGQVRSVDRLVGGKGGTKRLYKGRTLRPHLNPYGYLQLTLSKNNKATTFKVHRLVALTFLENPDQHLDVNHINEIKTDNRLENLEWASKSDNINHGTRNKQCADKLGRAVKGTCLRTNKEFIFASMMDAQRELGVNNGGIAATVNGKQKQSGGYRWEAI